MKFADRLFRNPVEGKLAGVCAGLADYSGIDALWIRLAFVGVTIWEPWVGILAYIALAIAVPEGADEVKRTETRSQRPKADRFQRNAQSASDPSIDAEIAEMRARLTNLEAEPPVSRSYGDIPQTLEGDTSRKSGRTLEGAPASRRKVMER